MKQIIKRILTEATNPKMDKVLNLLVKKYPNPIKEMIKGMEYLEELGFDNEEVMSIYKYHIKNEFPNVMGVDDYFYIFDGLFQPDTIEYYFDRGVNDDNAEENYIIYNNTTDEGDYNDIPVMELRTKDYFGRRSVNNVKRDQAPILEINTYHHDTLNSLFGSKWKEPFKIWFEERFDREVNTII
jgi:hypothetical protein